MLLLVVQIVENDSQPRRSKVKNTLILKKTKIGTLQIKKERKLVGEKQNIDDGKNGNLNQIFRRVVYDQY